MPAIPPTKKDPKNEKKGDEKTNEDKKKDVSSKKPVVEIETPLKTLRRNLFLLEKLTTSNNREKLPRIFRNNTRIRREITPQQLAEALELYLPSQNLAKNTLIQFVQSIPPRSQPMEIDDGETKSNKEDTKDEPHPFQIPEVEVYLHLIIVSLLVKEKMIEKATCCVTSLVDKLSLYNRRTLDHFHAKALFYYSLCYEMSGNLAATRGVLIAAHRTACLQHNEIGQAMTLNLLLRNYLHYNLYEQAFKLVSKTTFPQFVSNNQFVRYLYYVGKIQAIQLDYTEAYTKLMQSIRKSPQNIALGFRLAVHKLAIIVHLHIGEIPERALFNQPELKKALIPYLELTNAVRVGNLVEFNSTLEEHATTFKDDKTYTLILRLRHNVIKTGLRKINLSYSRISFQDICRKLALETPIDAEFVCAKAIRDGVIDAIIDHEKGWMQSKETGDIYVSNDPQQAFHKRITFCLDVHNEAVKAMRYPADAYKKELESAEQRQEREKQEEELAKEIEDEMDEGL